MKTYRPNFQQSLTTEVKDSVITDRFKEHNRELLAWITDTRLAHLRDALIAMGWTPPPEKPE